MRPLDGRVALVTGGAAGIGRAISRRLAKDGASVLIADINGEAAEASARAIRSESGREVQAQAVDVTKAEQVDDMVSSAVARFGRLDIVINNAWGGGTFRRAENKSDEEIARGLDINIWGVFWTMKAAFPHLKASGNGRVVSICSINGVRSYTGTLEYNIGKEGLRSLTTSLAREWAQYQICANVLCPAADTVALRALIEQSPQLATSGPLPPMGRIGDPETDIAGVAAFLCGDDARYLTGNCLFVDGGMHINGGGWNVELPE